MIKYTDIKDAAKEALIKASTQFREDQLKAYQDALGLEQNENSKWVLEQTISNAQTAQAKRLVLCDDTGIPHVYVRIGEEAILQGNFLSAISEGIALGLAQLPGRPMAVKGVKAGFKLTHFAGLNLTHFDELRV